MTPSFTTILGTVRAIAVAPPPATAAAVSAASAAVRRVRLRDRLANPHLREVSK
ncbi:hypothetical protein GCM10009727_86340 [Actinomadura napierensis]|uniref:Secreted protein n=1 Tax=Actinomadura napierensis TaxID=267854 RepID=A0ABN3AG44_9ACTN